MKNQTCPVCAEGLLTQKHQSVQLEYSGRTKEGRNQFSKCDTCKSEMATAVDAKFNKREMIAFKKTVLGLLTGSEVKALRKRLGINQEQAAQVFGGGPVAFSKYESDDVMQSEAMDKLLRLALNMPEVANKLLKDANVGQSYHYDNITPLSAVHKPKITAKHKHAINVKLEAEYA